MDRVRRISEQVIEKYPTLFTDDYQKNKEALESIALFSSKMLKNKVAGYITKLKSGDSGEAEGEGTEEAPAE